MEPDEWLIILKEPIINLLICRMVVSKPFKSPYRIVGSVWVFGEWRLVVIVHTTDGVVEAGLLFDPLLGVVFLEVFDEILYFSSCGFTAH